MKTYYTRLFNYDRYANDLMLKAILEANKPGKPVQLMAHLFAASRVWLARCKELPLSAYALWPEDANTDTFATLNEEINQNWITYLDGLQPDDFEKIISYKNSRGDAFENRLSDILAHVINHGTHHRAQIGQLLKSNGLENLPITDYIFYIREQGL
jgi:uncharacterized damage-inducible protein DinB